ncbi:hypothetical protein HD554DRAFT_1026016 [Boletus coccyginus]|nr:hypothetical protein HD554DRAFT_1026016 [Boletus coccyginus]
MAIPEVLDIFEDYTRKENIPYRLIDLERLCLVDIDSIEEADIERHTSYANQRREDVIRTIVKGVVKYAILSHKRLPSDQFRYHDMVSDAPRIGPGWHKMEQFCEIARDSFRCQFAWADPICIDYTNRLDRESATQSLFDWYRNAYVCIAHLATASDPSDMCHDEWFYRGFTLTELLAPVRMKFYGAGWKALNNDYIDNDKADAVFLDLLSKASWVPIDDLRTFWPGPDRIRHKLFWASRRETTRVEDKAYSLMAIFDSRISVNYGEGEMAFTRLMIDVIPKSGECDVFAWAGPCSHDHPGLPPSPAGFGEEHRDQQLNPTPHHYRLCGDRSVSIDLDHLRIRAVVLEISLPPEGVASYKPVLLWHRASVSEVTLLRPHDLAAGVDTQKMAVGVIDYSWTGSPNEGRLRQGDQYFCFLLYKSSSDEEWQKVLTERVAFLVNGQELVQELELLCIYTRQSAFE